MTVKELLLALAEGQGDEPVVVQLDTANGQRYQLTGVAFSSRGSCALLATHCPDVGTCASVGMQGGREPEGGKQ